MPDDPPDHQAAPADSDPVFTYDVFISYSSKDQAWVRGTLLQRLEAHGLRVCIDFRDFQPGAPFVTEMERAVLTSRYTLVVLTPDFVSSTWTQFEEVLTFTVAHGFQQRRVIPLLKAACTPPWRIQALVAVDFTDSTRYEGAYARLLAALSPASPDMQGALIPRTTAPAPVPMPSASRMPFDPDTRFLTINALAERGIALSKQLTKARFGMSHLALVDARAWHAAYTAWVAESLSMLDVDLLPHFEDAHLGNEEHPGVEQILTLLVQSRDPDPGIAESAQATLRPIVWHHPIDEILYPQQDLLETARRRAFPATHAVTQELKDVIAASQRRYTNGRIDYLFTNNGCESHWWLRPIKWYTRKSERRVHGWFDAIQVYASHRERAIVQAVGKTVLREGRLTHEECGALQRHLEGLDLHGTR